MKKWITVREINVILKAYSIRANEFEKLEKCDNTYINRKLGYTISISRETECWNDGSLRETGRILVSHARGNGKRTYLDIWERDKEGKLQFRHRNLPSQPVSDAECIRELEQRIAEYQKLIREIIIDKEKAPAVPPESAEHALSSTPQPIHNARGAGRKANPKRLEKLASDVRQLAESGKSEKEIMEIMGISRATYFRYKKAGVSIIKN